MAGGEGERARVAADWIAADWGTSNLRAWAMGRDDAVLARAEGPGMDSLAPEGFEPALLEAVAPWLPDQGAVEVLVCGMAGARSGWREVPYLDLPAPLHDLAGGLTAVETRDPRLSVRIVPGLAQREAEQPDVMRGEETQLLGLTQLQPGFSGLACLPGTHSKWAQLDGLRVVRFRSYLTGELYGLLTRQSILRRSLAGTETDPTAFTAGVNHGLAAPDQLLASLFTPRAAGLLLDWSSAYAGSWLSGALIGAETAAARQAFGGSLERVALVGAGALVERYAAAFRHCGLSVLETEGEAAVIAGLSAIRGLTSRSR